MFENGIPGLDYGFMTCDSGNMFGGKTESLIRRVKRLKLQDNLREDFCRKINKSYRPLRVGVFVHELDTRYSNDGTYIVSHSGMRLPAIPIGSVNELITIVNEKKYDVIAIDESQFFFEKDENGFWSIVRALKEFKDENKFVLVAGLEKDFRGYPFGPMGDLLALSDEKECHYSVCTVCGGPATLPQRLVNGSPAYEDDPIVMVGAKESYEPRCIKHHIIKKREKANVNQQIG